MGFCQQLEDHNNDNNNIVIDGPIIIGAGPSGLATAACLTTKSIPYLILERSDCIASLWHHRTYDRLKLHLPKHFCQLPHMSFPSNYPKYPNRQQFLSYIHSYASKFNIKPHFCEEVRNAAFDNNVGMWKVETRKGVVYWGKWVVVATGENAEPVGAEIAGMDRFDGEFIHASNYRNGKQFEAKKVLVVGCGNTGMEISLDLAKHAAFPTMVVRNSVHVLPREFLGFSTFGVAMLLLKFFPLRMVDKFLLLMAYLTLGSTDKLGVSRPKTGPLELKHATGKTPVLDVGTISLIRSGKIKVRKGVKEVTNNGVKFADGQQEQFDTIILATGYRSNVPSWLKGDNGDVDNKLFTDTGMPRTPFPNGWKLGDNGLYTVGFTRRGLQGASSDAVKAAMDIASRWEELHHLK